MNGPSFGDITKRPAISREQTMMRDYYHNNFYADLRRFMPRADLPYFVHSWEIDCAGLEQVPAERRPEFLVCLYFTVLLDQAIRSYFPQLHSKFEALTHSPKFCHGAGQFQKNPRLILDVQVDRNLVTREALAQAIPKGMELFVDEIINLSTHHMAEIKPDIFFEKLLHDSDVEIRLLVVMVDPKIKAFPAYKTYENLREAVARRLVRKSEAGERKPKN
jgi:hypothetical protein